MKDITPCLSCLPRKTVSKMRTWYEVYGWDKDPFSVRPNKNLVGLHKEKKECIDFIITGDFSLVVGPTGSGKSSLLLWLEKELKTMKLTPVRINCVEKNTSLEIIKELHRHRRLKDKIFLRKYPKKAVLLLDEAQFLSKDAGEIIKVQWDEGRVHAVVMASIEKDLTNLSGSLTDRFKNQVISLPKLSLSDAINLIKIRADKKNPFDDDASRTLAELSENIPRRLLENSKKVCMYCAEKGILEINKYHVYAAIPLVRAVVPLPSVEQRQGPLIKEELTPIPSREQRQKTIKTVKKTIKTVEEPRKTVTLSPAQTEIVKLLSTKELSAVELSVALKTSLGSIQKQLSRLNQKGVVMLADATKRPVTYKLCESTVRESIKE